jgi:YD repeat-containing protein
MKRFFKSIFAFLLAVFFSLPALSGFKADAEVWVGWDNLKELGTFATREKACEAFGPFFLKKGMSPEWSVSTSNNEAENFCEVTAVHVNSTVNFYKLEYAYFYNCPSGTVKSGAWCYCPDGRAEFGRACLAPPVVSANENMCRAEGKIFGNPVLPASAEKFRSETDWKGEGPFAIDFVRTYRSKVDLNHARSQSVLGPGWTHNHDIRLVALGNDDDRTVLISASHEQMDAFRSTDKGVTWTAFAGAASLSRSSGGGWTYLPALDDAVWSFDGDGKLRSRKLLNGWEMVYTYDAQGFLQSVRNSFGAEITLEYDAQARLKKISPPDGGALQYEYDSDGRLISVSYPDGTSRGFLYEVPGENFLLTGIVGEDGNRLGYFNFDADGRVISSELAGGVERYSVAYPYQSYARVKDPLGTERTYTYSMKAAQLVVNSATMPSADGRSSVNGRNQDDSGLIEMERDFRGFIKLWVWDTSRRLPLKITEAAGSAEQRTTTTLWHPQWRLPAKVTRAGSEASYGYDGAGNLLSLVLKDTTVAPARSRTWSWSYHPSGLVATQTQPNGAITRFNYDGSGNLTQSTNALNQTETYTHDSAGRVLTHLSASGVASSFQYDARGRLVRMQLGGHVSLYSYSPAGQLATAGTPQGYTLTYRYDQAHRLTGWSDNRGAGASYTLDGMGNRVLEQIVDPQGKAAWQLARSINSINRVERVTFGGVDGAEVPSTIHYGYNANGDLAYTTQTANGVSGNTVLDLDPLRRVKTITNAHNASAALFYDTQDAVTWASDFKNVVSEYARDALGNATQETTPDAGNSTATYDALGLIATAKDAAGRTFAVQRDALGRPTQLQYGGTSPSTLRYDLPGTTYNGPGAPKASTGHLSEIQDPGVTTQYQRDILGRLLRKSQILPNGDTKAVVHTYVPAGQGGAGELQSITYPSGKQATYLYDSTGQITGLQWNGQPLLAGLAWSPLGQPTAWQWPGFAQQPGATATLAEQRSYNTAANSPAANC